MDHRQLKGKDKGGNSEPSRKQNMQPDRLIDRVPRTSPFPRGQARRFEFKVICAVGKKWYTKYPNTKYILKVFIVGNTLA